MSTRHVEYLGTSGAAAGKDGDDDDDDGDSTNMNFDSDGGNNRPAELDQGTGDDEDECSRHQDDNDATASGEDGTRRGLEEGRSSQGATRSETGDRGQDGRVHNSGASG